MTYLPQETIRYSTYIKRAVVEALRDVFADHVDEILRETKIKIQSPKAKADYPTIFVKFYEREIKPVGIGGGEQWIDLSFMDFEGVYRFKKSFYWADLEFEILALSTPDRDLIGDSLIQTIQMGNLESYTNQFFERIYPSEEAQEDVYPDSVWHYISINTDQISGFGEREGQTPWASEDGKIYKKSYRVPVFGEFYSVPPEAPAGFIEKVNLFPYMGGIDDIPEGDPDDHGEWWPPIGT